MIATFIVTAVASVGMPAQFPLSPRTSAAYVLFAASGVLRDLMLSGAGRVSISRQGVIDTNDDNNDAAAADPLVEAARTPLAPATNTNAAPNVYRHERTPTPANTAYLQSLGQPDSHIPPTLGLPGERMITAAENRR